MHVKQRHQHIVQLPMNIDDLNERRYHSHKSYQGVVHFALSTREQIDVSNPI